ncbi:MAG: hypothetical protein DRO62_02015 [Candidatus Altiarchaeales archaeon]|nr:MAG: hypothetical protein DRO62_02015 [Candidatus Altiarchaeales archaeon]
MPTTCTTIPFSKQNGINLQQNLNDIISAASSTWDRVKEPISWVRDFMKKPYYEGTFDIYAQPFTYEAGLAKKSENEGAVGSGVFNYEKYSNGRKISLGPNIGLNLEGENDGINIGVGGFYSLENRGENISFAMELTFSGQIRRGGTDHGLYANCKLPLFEKTYNNETNVTTYEAYPLLFTLTDLVRDKSDRFYERPQNCTINGQFLENGCEFEYPRYWVGVKGHGYDLANVTNFSAIKYAKINLTKYPTARFPEENKTGKIGDCTYEIPLETIDSQHIKAHCRKEIETPTVIRITEFLGKTFGGYADKILDEFEKRIFG